MTQKTGIWTKLVYMFGALIALSVGGMVMYGPVALSEVAPGAAIYVPEDHRIGYGLAGLGVCLFVAAFWPRMRSFIGFAVVSALTILAFWLAVNSQANVFFLMLFWGGGLVGTFAMAVYFIAFVRGRDAL